MRAIEVTIEPTDAVPCTTPVDGPLPDAGAAPPAPKAIDLGGRPFVTAVTARSVLVLGGARLARRLAVGATLCGWTRTVAQAGLYYPSGSEGELADGSGTLLGAWSFAFDRDAPPTLARAWQFAREGAVKRQPIDEGGAFVRHERVRVRHAGASAVSVGGAEAILEARDGTFAVVAVSDLTEGNVPVFVGRHDTFGFGALRLDAAR